MCSVIICIKYHYILYHLLQIQFFSWLLFVKCHVPMRFLVILMLGLQLAIDLCHGSGFEELCRKQYCNADPSKNCNCPAKKCPSMGPSESTTFSCGNCSPGTMYDPYVCQYCYKGTKENEAFTCQNCKIGETKSKAFICDDCKTNPAPESNTGFNNSPFICF